MEESPLYLGYVGLANAIPAIAFNLLGGVLADKLDKKRLILVTQLVMAAVIFLLATLIVLEAVRVWHVLTIAVIIGAVGAFDQPARQALYPYTDRPEGHHERRRPELRDMAGHTDRRTGDSRLPDRERRDRDRDLRVRRRIRGHGGSPVRAQDAERAPRRPGQGRARDARRRQVHMEQLGLLVPDRHVLLQQLLRDGLRDPECRSSPRTCSGRGRRRTAPC